MADNFLSQVYSHPYPNEGLHTKSAYLKDRTFNISNFNIPSNMAAIETCRSREQRLYQHYNCFSFEEFMRKIKNHFLVNPNDAKVFQNFQYVNLTIKLNELAQKYIPKQTQFEQISLEIKVNEKTNDDIKKALASLGFGDEFTLRMGVDLDKFKTVLSAIRKTLGKRGGLHTSSKGISTATREIIAEIEKTGIVSMKPTEGVRSVSDIIAEDRAMAAFPWGFKKADIETALNGGDPHMKARLEAAYKVLRTFFIETLTEGGSPEIKQAARIVWEDKLGTQLDSRISFFEKGNVNDLKVGAGGEYAAAMMFVYFDIVFGGAGKNIAKIAGDEATRGMQGKIDVEALQSYGIQVKNFNMAARQASGNTLIKAGTNPGIFSQYLPEDQGEDLRMFFANYYFNKDFAQQSGREKQFNEVVWEMRQYFYALYNLALSDVLERDQVSFYVIGSRYIVPASVIIETATRRKDGVPFEIKLPYNQKTDEELSKLKNYWVQPSPGFWIPTEENKAQYENYVYRQITIKSDIDYSLFIGELEKSEYSLY